MEFVRGLINLRERKQCVATIGNFDGVHLGHRAVIEQLKVLAGQSGLPTSIIIFEPQPIEFFSKKHVPSRLMWLRDKLKVFNEYKIDRVICLSFNRAIAEQDAECFAYNILCERIGVRYLVVGDDFCFGKNRDGDFDLLTKIGREKGFEVVATRSFCLRGKRVSSTAIRSALHTGNIHRANTLLGRPYRISGRVVHGEKRGLSLGYPTANIEFGRYHPPLHGIFTSYIYGVSRRRLPAVSYIGIRPVFAGEKAVLEVHILDFNQGIYGKRIEVELVSKLRDDAHFYSIPALLGQIEKDIKKARTELM